MPAGVAADVQDQTAEPHLGSQIAIEVRPPRSHHVRDVQVAQASLAELADQGAPPGHPVLVAQPPFVPQRHHDDGAQLPGRRPDGEFDRLADRPGQQRPRTVHRVDRLPVHRHQLIAGPDGAPWSASSARAAWATCTSRT